MNALLRRAGALLLLTMALSGCSTVGSTIEAADKKYARLEDIAVAERQVANFERDFSRSMEERNFAAFQALLSDEAIFMNGPPGAEGLRGKAAVAEHWKRFFEGPKAPFTWEPRHVQVLDSGQLALSTGPVYDPNGRQIATFTSIWRKEGPAIWRVLFDHGCSCADKR